MGNLRLTLTTSILAFLLTTSFLMVTATAPETVFAYAPHDPIFIDGDAGFTPANGVTGGSGTASDPYIIEGWEIDATTADGIMIQNTTAHFTVRDCYVHDGGTTYNGILLLRCSNGTVTGDNCSNNRYGIFLSSSSDNTLSGNNCSSNNVYGIFLFSSSDNTLSGNNCSSINYYGIFLYSSGNNTLSGNNCSSNDHGIRLISSGNNTLRGNNCSSNSYYGISLSSSSDNTLRGNNCSSNSYYGIFLSSSSDNTLRGNNCSSNNYYGIVLSLSGNNTLSGNNCGSNSYYGIFLHSSGNNTLSGNNCSSNNYDGMFLSASSDNTLSGNKVCSNGEHGIYLSGCTGTTAYSNIFLDNVVDHAHGDGGSENFWNASYPIGGNYWDNYNGIDMYSGSNQDQPGPDGIGDIPYEIDADSLDYYPLMAPSITPPTITVPDTTGVWQGYSHWYIVDAGDPDLDALRFTWDWGDGGIDVTTVPTAAHVYVWKGFFALTVYADDLTGIPGHNVSDIGYVQVLGFNTPPSLASWCVDNANPYTGEKVTFTASAHDAEGDSLRFTFSFGDGTSAVEQAEYTAPNTLVTFSVSKTYDNAGLMTAMIYVWDGFANVSGAPLTIDVLPNARPIVMPLLDLWGIVDEALTFEANAFDPDPMDVLTFTWDFGDGTPLVVGNPAIHSYTSTDVYQYRVWVDDGHGYNVTIAAKATIGETLFTLNLLAGWNLVTIPLVGHGYSASTLGLSVGDVVVGWNSETEAYDKVYFVGLSPPTTDFDIVPGVGYWVSSATAKTLDLHGFEAVSAVSVYVEVPLGGGWVIVGVPSLDTGLWASDVVGMYGGGQVIALAAYDAVSKTYLTHFPGYPADFIVSPGAGLWLCCTAGGWFSYNP